MLDDVKNPGALAGATGAENQSGGLDASDTERDRLSQRRSRLRDWIDAATTEAARWADLDACEREAVFRAGVTRMGLALRTDDAVEGWAEDPKSVETRERVFEDYRRRGRPALTREEKQRAGRITLDDTPEERAAAAYLEMTPEAQARFRRALEGRE